MSSGGGGRSDGDGSGHSGGQADPDSKPKHAARTPHKGAPMTGATQAWLWDGGPWVLLSTPCRPKASLAYFRDVRCARRANRNGLKVGPQAIPLRTRHRPCRDPRTHPQVRVRVHDSGVCVSPSVSTRACVEASRCMSKPTSTSAWKDRAHDMLRIYVCSVVCTCVL